MSDVWAGIAGELLHFYPRGTRTAAVAGEDAERSRLAADALAAALEAADQEVVHVRAGDGDETQLRELIVSPFRSEQADRILLVSGDRRLLSPAARGMWNFSVWQLAGDETPHTVANAIVDVTDPQNPARRFADYCALPAAFGS